MEKENSEISALPSQIAALDPKWMKWMKWIRRCCYGGGREEEVIMR